MKHVHAKSVAAARMDRIHSECRKVVEELSRISDNPDVIRSATSLRFVTGRLATTLWDEVHKAKNSVEQ